MQGNFIWIISISFSFFSFLEMKKKKDTQWETLVMWY